MTKERLFKSIELVKLADDSEPDANKLRLLAIADDGTAWASGANFLALEKGSSVMTVQAMEWRQIKPLPDKTE